MAGIYPCSNNVSQKNCFNKKKVVFFIEYTIIVYLVLEILKSTIEVTAKRKIIKCSTSFVNGDNKTS